MSCKRVVLVCMVDSIHVARWIAQFEPSEVEFTLFPSTPNRRVHAMIKDLMDKQGNIRIVPFGGRLSILLWGTDLVFSDHVRGLLLRRVLKSAQPDFVHALELQHGGYITSRALEDDSVKTTFIATNYGSDIYWFQQFPKHLAKIKKLLARADRYSAECNRDVVLAKKYGFTGEVMPVIPNAGGYPREVLWETSQLPSKRKMLLIKGYNGWAGQAAVAVAAIELLSRKIQGHKVVFYSVDRRFSRRLKALERSTGLDVEWHRKGSLSHSQMLNMFRSAKLYIGLSRTDGIGTSMLDAMVSQTFVLQTSTSCLDEWFPRDTISAIDDLDAKTLAERIDRVLNQDFKIDEETAMGLLVARERLLDTKISSQARLFYQEEIV